MALVAVFTFNPFLENTYVVYDASGECVIIDPGCSTREEYEQLDNFLSEKKLQPRRLLNTHCHLDHILGNKQVSGSYKLDLEIHEGELPVLRFASQASMLYGIPYEPSPEPARFIEEGETVTFGETRLKAILAPGHSPASLCFFCEEDRFLIGGDVLFQGSIGRTDLPGGDYDTLINSIADKLLPLGDDVKVYCGHGPATTIGAERKTNPFLVSL